MSINEFPSVLMNRHFLFKRGCYYLDHQEALELVCVLQVFSTKTAVEASE
ncbi:hypothetical protein [Bacillus salacetis]|nr:hypothetical protein [Bacillus salacetis]